MKHLPHSETISTAGETRPSLTLLHGASQHSGLFSAQVAEFQRDHRLLLIDLPGHGRSSAIPGPYGLAEYARSVLAVIRAARLERTHFWGTHTGAGIGLMLAAEHPQLIASLVLDGAILPGVDLPYVSARLAQAKKTARERGVEAAKAEWFRESRWFDVIRKKPEECRAKEHWDRTNDPEDAMVGGVAHSGRVIFAAGAVMVAVFFTFALSGPLPPKEMGVILGIAVLLDAALVRLLLVPVMLRLLGRWAWWLPRPLDRLLPDVRFGHA